MLVWAGAGLLGWIAGELLVEDPVSRPYFDALGRDYGLNHTMTEYAMQVACTLVVIVCGWLLKRWHTRASRRANERAVVEAREQKSAAE